MTQSLYAQPNVLANPPALFVEAEHILHQSRQAIVEIDDRWIASKQADNPESAKQEVHDHYSELVTHAMRGSEVVYMQKAVAQCMQEHQPDLDSAQHELSITNRLQKYPATTRLPFAKYDWVYLYSLAIVLLAMLAGGFLLAGRTLYLATAAGSVATGIIMVLPILSGGVGLKIAYGTYMTPKARTSVLRAASLGVVLAWAVYITCFATLFADAGSFKAEDAVAMFSLTAPTVDDKTLLDHWAWRIVFVFCGMILEAFTTAIILIHAAEIMDTRRKPECIETALYQYYKSEERMLRDILGHGRSILAQLQGQRDVINGKSKAVATDAVARLQTLHDEREKRIKMAEGYRAGQHPPADENGPMFCLNRG